MFDFSFDGHVDEIADPRTTTHILVTGDCQDIIALHDVCPKAHVVNIEWLDACVTHEKCLDTNIYEL